MQGTPNTSAGQWQALAVTFKDNTTWTFKPIGNDNSHYLLAQITNAVGRSIVFSYDNSNRLTSVVNDAAPAVTLFSLQYGAGFLSSIADPYGRAINYTFPSCPRLERT